MSPLMWVPAIALALAAAPARGEDLPAASRRAADALATLLAASPEGGAVRAVALLPPKEGPGAAGHARAVVDAVAARLAQAARVKVLDAAALESALGEQKLRAMLGAGSADGPELARAGAQASVSGTLQLRNGRLELALTLALVPAGKVLGTAHAAAEVAPRPQGESGAIEVAMRRLSDGLAGGFARLPGSARYHRLAVLTFGEVGDGPREKRLGTIVTAEVATNLRRDHGLLLVERARLGEVLGELKLQQMTAPDAAQATRIGQLADAQALVIGSVAEAGDRYLVTARIVATQTGETLAAESVGVAQAGLAAVASDAVVLRSRGDAAFRSLLLPGLGQAYNRQPAKAWAFAGAEAALLGAALGYHLAARSARDDYDAVGPGTTPSPSAEASRLHDLAESRTATRNWLLAGAAALWAANVVDAWASGVDGEALLGGRVAVGPAAGPGGAGLVLAGRF